MNRSASRDAKGPPDSVTITIKTPANHIHDFEVRLHDRVDKVGREAVQYFVGTDELAEGPYSLALVHDGVATSLDDAARLEDAGVRDGDTLALISKQPQVDG